MRLEDRKIDVPSRRRPLRGADGPAIHSAGTARGLMQRTRRGTARAMRRDGSCDAKGPIRRSSGDAYGSDGLKRIRRGRFDEDAPTRIGRGGQDDEDGADEDASREKRRRSQRWPEPKRRNRRNSRSSIDFSPVPEAVRDSCEIELIRRAAGFFRLVILCAMHWRRIVRMVNVLGDNQ